MNQNKFKTFIASLMPKGKLARGVIAITSGSALGQIVVLAAAPVIARFYGPEEFGLLAVYTGLLGILTVVASLRYQLAIPLPRSHGTALNILVLSLMIVGCVALLSALLVLFFGASISSWTNAPKLQSYLWLLPAGIVLAGSYQVFNYWAIRKGDFKTIGRTRLQQSAGMAGTQILLGIAHAGPAGLIAGQIVGQAAGLTRLIRNTVRDHRNDFTRIRRERMLQSARRYRDFPIYLSLSGLLNKAGTQLPLILFSALFSPAVAGFYLFAYRLTSRPTSLFSESIRQVFFSGASKAARDGRVGDVTYSAFRGLTRIGFAPLVFAGIIAPEFFALLFGPQWIDAGQYVQWMVPSLVATFIVSPMTTLNVVLERQKFGVLFQAVLLAGKLAAMLAGAHFGGPLLAIGCFSITSAIIYLVFGLWIASTAGASFTRLLSLIASEAIYVLPFWALLVLTKPGFSAGWLEQPQFKQVGWLISFLIVSGSIVLWRSVFTFRRTVVRRPSTT